MSNLKHYIQGISSGNEFFTLSRKFAFLNNALIIFNIYLTVIFYFIDCMPLMLFAFVAALYYGVIVKKTINKESFPSALIMTMFEIIIMSFFATMCLGIETGFIAYSIGLITACFYFTFVIDAFRSKEFIPFVLSIISVCCFLLNYIIMLFIKPFYTIENPVWVTVLFLSNYIFVFAIIIAFSFLLVWEIKLSNNILVNQNAQLDDMAHKDPLTRLYNRRFMNKYLNASIEALKLKGDRFCVIIGDIDDFKKVNDNYGHEAGDEVLKAVAQIITENVRENDYVCRWGGEEILILINGPFETATTAAERIRQKLENSAVVYYGKEIRVTMTFGVTESIPGYRIEQLIQQADERLYEGKHSGKNRVISS